MKRQQDETGGGRFSLHGALHPRHRRINRSGSIGEGVAEEKVRSGKNATVVLKDRGRFTQNDAIVIFPLESGGAEMKFAVRQNVSGLSGDLYRREQFRFHLRDQKIVSGRGRVDPEPE